MVPKYLIKVEKAEGENLDFGTMKHEPNNVHQINNKIPRVMNIYGNNQFKINWISNNPKSFIINNPIPWPQMQ